MSFSVFALWHYSCNTSSARCLYWLCHIECQVVNMVMFFFYQLIMCNFVQRLKESRNLIRIFVSKILIHNVRNELYIRLKQISYHEKRGFWLKRWLFCNKCTFLRGDVNWFSILLTIKHICCWKIEIYCQILTFKCELHFVFFIWLICIVLLLEE